jgi:hypothetical protein
MFEQEDDEENESNEPESTKNSYRTDYENKGQQFVFIFYLLNKNYLLILLFNKNI